MENLNLDHPKLFQRQRANDSTREKPTRSPVCQSPLTVAQSNGGFHKLLQKKGAKLYSLSLAGLGNHACGDRLRHWVRVFAFSPAA